MKAQSLHGNHLTHVMESLDRQIEALTKARDLLRDDPLPPRKQRGAPAGKARTQGARILKMALRP